MRFSAVPWKDRGMADIVGRISRPVRTRDNAHVMPHGSAVRVVGYVIEMTTPMGEVWVGEAVQEDFTKPPDVEEFLKSKPTDICPQCHRAL